MDGPIPAFFTCFHSVRTDKFSFTGTQENPKVRNYLQAGFYMILKFILKPILNRLQETCQRNAELKGENECFVHLLTCHLSSDFYHGNSDSLFTLAYYTIDSDRCKPPYLFIIYILCYFLKLHHSTKRESVKLLQEKLLIKILSIRNN